jgi:hypothetical protein
MNQQFIPLVYSYICAIHITMMKPRPPIHLPPCDCMTSLKAKVWLYRLRGVQRPFKQLGLNVSREICLYIGHQGLLPAISGNLLRLLNLETGTCTDITLRRSFTSGTVYCVLPDSAIIAIGGSFASSAVYSLSIHTYEITPLSPLLQPRTRPGLQVYAYSIYLFGGRNGAALTACESLQSVSGKWRAEADMYSPKAGFWPCEYAGDIYLCDPCEDGDCLEAYTVRTRTIRTFPGLITCLSHSSIACIYAGEMLILPSNGSLLRLQFPKMTIREGAVGYLADFKAESNVTPMQVGSRIYWVSPGNCVIHVFDAVSKAKEVLGS